jgi:hypothetical protein
LFGGVYGLFLTLNPRRSNSNHRVLSAAVVGNCARSSANVASGFAATSAFNRASWSARTRVRNSFVSAARATASRGTAEPTGGLTRGSARRSPRYRRRRRSPSRL